MAEASSLVPVRPGTRGRVVAGLGLGQEPYLERTVGVGADAARENETRIILYLFLFFLARKKERKEEEKQAEVGCSRHFFYIYDVIYALQAVTGLNPIFPYILPANTVTARFENYIALQDQKKKDSK